VAAVVSSQSYNPMGVPATDYGKGFGFTGEQTDANGLLYLRARYYAPSKGVFTALDPFEGLQDRPMSLNGYSWVEGNVPNWIDPSGELPLLETVGKTVAITAVSGSPTCRSLADVAADASPRVADTTPSQCNPRYYSLGTVLDSGQIATHDHWSPAIHTGQSLNYIQANFSVLYIDGYGATSNPVVADVHDFSAVFPIAGGGAMILQHSSINFASHFGITGATTASANLAIGDEVWVVNLRGNNAIWFSPPFSGYARNIHPADTWAATKDIVLSNYMPIGVDSRPFRRDSGAFFVLSGHSPTSIGDSGAGVFNNRFELIGVVKGRTDQQMGVFPESGYKDFGRYANLVINGCVAAFRHFAFGRDWDDAMPGRAEIAKIVI
jgi:RHS repeat-associated protein